MRLAELAFGCHVCGAMADYDASYRQFRESTRPRLDLSHAEHRLALLSWLNDWGCRQFALQYHGLASEQIREWYECRGARLPEMPGMLPTLADDGFSLIEDAYAGLIDRTASWRDRKDGTKSRIALGPTGAAKILFALRADVCLPWDECIRQKQGLDGSAAAYVRYLRRASGYLAELGCDCERHGFPLSDLPQRLGRSESSLPKLIDEYFWVTVTKGCRLPAKDDFIRWASWW